MGSMRRIITTVVLVALLLAGLDLGTRRYFEGQLAGQLQAAQGMPQPPNVRIGGGSFLAQAVLGRYSKVTVIAGEVPGLGLPIASVNAQLTGVKLPLTALFGSGSDTLPVRTFRGSTRIRFADLTTALAPALPPELTGLALAAGVQGRLRVSGTYSGLAVSIKLTTDANLAVDGESLLVNVPEDSLSQLPDVLRSRLAGLLTTKVPLPVLPAGLQITGVTVQPSGLVFSITGQNITLG